MSRDPLSWFNPYREPYKGRQIYNKTDHIKPYAPPPLIKSKIAKNILITLALGARGAIITMNPAGAVYFMVHGVIMLAMKDQDYKREIKRLKKNGYIALTKSPQGFAAKLLNRANQRIKKIVFDDLVLPKTTRWDGKWRLFIFDIPEEDRMARNMLRRKLKDLGMYNMQRSVFVYPYDCRKELEFISDHYGVARYATYLETNYIDIDKELRRYFKKLFQKGQFK